MPIVIPTVTAVDLESWVLDGLELNDGDILRVETVSDPPAAKKPDWVSGADSDGAILARLPKHENKVIELRMRVLPQSDMDAGIAYVAAILDKLQECEQNVDGLPLVWTPATSSLDPIVWRCLLGEITDLPKSWDGEAAGWWASSPVLTIRLTCYPFGLGAEYAVAAVTSSAPLITLDMADVPGDVPALGRLVVTDGASRAKRYVAWGLESRHYPTSSPPSLIVDSASMVTTGYAGTSAASGSAYGSTVVSATLRQQPQAICGLGNLSHVGSFRPQLRFYVLATTIALRLTYRVLDGPSRSLSYRIPVAVGWNHLDLGLIEISETTMGTQRWTGQIEAYSTSTGGESFLVDSMWLMPAELYGRARATYSAQSGVMTGYDDFTGVAELTPLNGRVAPAGGSWATSGATEDFLHSLHPGGEATVFRDTTSDASSRYAILGSTGYTDTDVRVRTQINGGVPTSGLVARWTDSNNCAALMIDAGGDAGGVTVVVAVAGSVTTLASIPFTRVAQPVTVPYVLRLVIYASGQGTASLLDGNGATLATRPFYHSALATGGALASGKVGILDLNSSTVASTRYYDEFYSSTPPAESIVCYADQSIEFRYDSTLREDSTGTYAGDPPEAIGAWFTIPNAGGPGRKSRVAVIARRNDVETTADDDVVANATMDSTTVTAFAIPRFLAVPR